MARFGAGFKATAVTGQLIPLFSVSPSALVGGALREVGIFNTTTTAFDVVLKRITLGPGTLGSAITPACITNPGDVAGVRAYQTSTGGTPTLTDLGYRASIGAAIGAGVIWTLGDVGGILPPTAGTLNGIGVFAENGNSQAAQIYFLWDE